MLKDLSVAQEIVYGNCAAYDSAFSAIETSGRHGAFYACIARNLFANRDLELAAARTVQQYIEEQSEALATQPDHEVVDGEFHWIHSHLYGEPGGLRVPDLPRLREYAS